MDLGVLIAITFTVLAGLGLAYVVKKKGLPKETGPLANPDHNTTHHAHS